VTEAGVLLLPGVPALMLAAPLTALVCSVLHTRCG
jgi:hypothetical protein